MACCISFEQNALNKCSQHGYNCPDLIIKGYRTFDGSGTWGLPHPDGLSYLKISWCPFCPAKLSDPPTELVDAQREKVLD